MEIVAKGDTPIVAHLSATEQNPFRLPERSNSARKYPERIRPRSVFSSAADWCTTPNPFEPDPKARLALPRHHGRSGQPSIPIAASQKMGEGRESKPASNTMYATVSRRHASSRRTSHTRHRFLIFSTNIKN